MNANRSWPGVPKMYIPSVSSTVMRPKSIATVVVTLARTCEASSTPADSVVIAASVVSGGISDTAETNVVLPTPNPPATTSFTDVTRRIVERRSEGPDTLDHPREYRELQLDGVAVGDFEAAGLDEITDEDHRDAERHPDLGRALGDRARFPTPVDGARVLEREMPRRVVDGLHHGLEAQRRVVGARAAAGEHERPHEVGRARFARRECSRHWRTLALSSETSAGVSAAPTRSTSSCI